MRKICFALLLLTGCSSTNVAQWQEKFSAGHPVIVSKISTIYGTGYTVIINQQTNTDVTVSPDGTVMTKSHQ